MRPTKAQLRERAREETSRLLQAESRAAYLRAQACGGHEWTIHSMAATLLYEVCPKCLAQRTRAIG